MLHVYLKLIYKAIFKANKIFKKSKIKQYQFDDCQFCVWLNQK